MNMKRLIFAGVVIASRHTRAAISRQSSHEWKNPKIQPVRRFIEPLALPWQTNRRWGF